VTSKERESKDIGEEIYIYIYIERERERERERVAYPYGSLALTVRFCHFYFNYHLYSYHRYCCRFSYFYLSFCRVSLSPWSPRDSSLVRGWKSAAVDVEEAEEEEEEQEREEQSSPAEESVVGEERRLTSIGKRPSGERRSGPGSARRGSGRAEEVDRGPSSTLECFLSISCTRATRPAETRRP
jgi:hypothetical protein